MRALLVVLALSLMPPALAGEPAGHEAQTVLASLLGPRPDISDYPLRDDFVRDVLAWEKRRAELQEKLTRGELPANSSAAGHDWHHITGPEDLDTALQNAEGYEQPHYQQTYRFNRTTHISFPLKRLPADKLAEKRVDADMPVTDEEMEALVQKLTDSVTSVEGIVSPQRPDTVSVPGIIRSQVESVLR